MSYFKSNIDGNIIYRSWDTKIKPADKMRVLVLKLDHIGDFWMSLGPLRALRRRFARAHITLVVGSWNINTARQFELADEYVAFDFFPRNPSLGKKPKGSTDIHSHVSGTFDLAIDMRVPDDTRRVLLSVSARHRAAIADRFHMPEIDIAIAPFDIKLRRAALYKLAQHTGIAGAIPRKWLDWFADRRQARLQHVTEILFFLVAKTAAYFDEPGQSNRIPDARADGVSNIVVAPFSNSYLRDWSAESFAHLTAALSVRGKVTLVGRSESQSALKVIADRACQLGATGLQTAVDLQEQDFNQLMKSATLVISNNSGAGHVAAQLGRPTIGIFTASHLPEIWGFQGPLVSILLRDIECRGCGLDAVKRCPVAVRCKSDIALNHVLAEIDALMGHVRELCGDRYSLAAQCISPAALPQAICRSG